MFDLLKSPKVALNSAKSTIISAMSSVSHSLRGLQATPPPVHSVLPTLPQPVLVYVQNLRVINKLLGFQEVQELKVEKVECRKSRKMTRHESMVAFAFDQRQERKSSNDKFLSFERAGGEATDVLQPTINRSATSITSISDSICPDLRALDMVSPLANGELREDEDIVVTLKFSKPYPSLIAVTLLAAIISTENPTYTLLSKNCYHFVGAMLAILRQEYAGELDINADARKCCGLNMSSAHKTDVPPLRASLN
jgi:hypothetical protein